LAGTQARVADAWQVPPMATPMNSSDQQPLSSIPGQPFPIHQGNETIVVPVLEERLRVDRQVVDTGSVRILKKVHEEEVQVDIPILTEQLEVERVPINQYIDTPPPSVRYEGDTMIVPVLREEIVVSTRLVLVEEVRITKRSVETVHSQQVTLRKEEVIVERTPTQQADGASS